MKELLIMMLKIKNITKLLKVLKELIMFIRHSRRNYVMPEAYHWDFTRVQEGHMRIKEKYTKYIGNGEGNERVLYDSP